MTRKRIISLFLVLFLLLAACAGPDTSRGQQHKVYLISKSTETSFWLSVFAGAGAARSEYNVDLVILGPETEEEYETQNAYIRQAVEEGAQAIVFSAISYTENAAAIDAAADAGVKIVVIDSDVDSDKVSARIGTDNIQAGRSTAEAVLKAPYDHLSVGIVNFAQVSRNGTEREQGMREVLEEDPRVDAIYTINVITNAASAKQGAVRLLEEHPGINVLVGLNEPLAVGTALAAADQTAPDRPYTVGFDTHTACVERMRTGIVKALIAQNPYAMGYLGVETAWKLLEGQTYDPESLIDTGTTIITEENMFTIEGQKALFPFN